ncbi:UNVERIFIED_CONTAM: hypothetical protein PO554_26920, partial [Klebsiella pneumoniae]
MDSGANILLSSLVFSPLLAILIIAFIPSRRFGAIKQVGVLGTLLPLILAFWTFGAFNYDTSNLQFVERHDWISIPIGLAQTGTVFAFEINYE